MSSLHYERKNKKGNGGKAFYVALGVCLIAVGVAAWTTYDSVVEFSSVEEENSSVSSQTTPAQNTLSGVTSSSKAPEESESQSDVVSEKPESQATQAQVSSAEPAPSREVQESSAEPSPPPEAETLYFPVGSTVTKNFSGEDPIYSETMQDWRVHSGVDLSAETGETVTSIASGTVLKTEKDDLLGNVISIQHPDGITAFYCGLGDTFLVKEGDQVESGQDIGSISSVPYESAERPHLHLEIQKDGKLIDPLSVLEEK